MATLQEIRQKADAKLADFWALLQSKQEAYHAKHGKYFQLLISPETNVIDGVDSDFVVRKPSDERHSLDVDFQWATKIPFQIAVSEWQGGKKEAGYVATVIVSVNGTKYTRSRYNDNTDTGWGVYSEPI